MLPISSSDRIGNVLFFPLTSNPSLLHGKLLCIFFSPCMLFSRQYIYFLHMYIYISLSHRFEKRIHFIYRFLLFCAKKELPKTRECIMCIYNLLTKPSLNKCILKMFRLAVFTSLWFSQFHYFKKGNL